MIDFVWLVKNEQHKLLAQQKKLLDDFANACKAIVKTINVPAEGLTLEQIEQEVHNLPARSALVFLSPIPAFILMAMDAGFEVYAFHNDKRTKKVLPDGRVIMTVPDDGWVLI